MYKGITVSGYPEYVAIGVKVVHETEMAVLLDNGDTELWVPKSCIRDGYDIDYEGNMDLDIALWFAEREEWV